MSTSKTSASSSGTSKGRAFKIGAVAVLLIAAFFTGRATSPTSPQPEDQDPSNAKLNHRDNGPRHSRQRLSEDQEDRTRRLSTSMTHALGEPDANERYGTSWAIIDKISHENWKEILDSFHANAKKKGYLDQNMLNEAFKRVGQVCGREAIAYYTDRGEDPNWSIIYGWAMAEPDEAVAWAEDSKTSYRRIDLLNSIIAGATRIQYEKGSSIMNSLPDNEWHRCLGHYVWNTVHGPGVDSAEAWASSQTDETRRATSINHVHGAVINSARLGRSPDKLAAWITATDDGTPESSSRTYALIGETLKSHPENGAQLIQNLSNANHANLSDPNVLAGNISGYFSENNVQTLTDWAQNTNNRELGDAMLRSINVWQNLQTAKGR